MACNKANRKSQKLSVLAGMVKNLPSVSSSLTGSGICLTWDTIQSDAGNHNGHFEFDVRHFHINYLQICSCSRLLAGSISVATKRYRIKVSEL